ncbi:MAG TPA: kelch repeat-containing protein [Gemmatimonadales bacterium]
MSRLVCSPALPAFLLTIGALGLAGCDGSPVPTQPDVPGAPAPSTSLAAAANTWTDAPGVYTTDIYGFDLGMAPNAAGQSIVYAFGGTSSDEGGTGKSVQVYNSATQTWTRNNSQVGVYYSNGVAKIGNRLYFSGGYVTAGNLPDATTALWAYDYVHDRMIRRADLPIFSAEGVSGAIEGRLYVLPGACNGNGWPNAGFCEVEQTRRFYRYDPMTNTWATRRQAPHFHRRGAAAVLGDKLYVAGGLNESLQGLADLDVYDPATNVWRTLAPLPAAGAAQGAALQGRFFVVVQSNAGLRAYVYNPKTNRWNARAVPGIFGSATRVTLDGSARVFMATGGRSALYTP